MDWREKLKTFKEKLEVEREELRLTVKLASMEARDELEVMETKWQAFKEKVAESEITEDARETADKLAAELKEGYSKLKDKIS